MCRMRVNHAPSLPVAIVRSKDGEDGDRRRLDFVVRVVDGGFDDRRETTFTHPQPVIACISPDDVVGS